MSRYHRTLKIISFALLGALVLFLLLCFRFSRSRSIAASPDSKSEIQNNREEDGKKRSKQESLVKEILESRLNVKFETIRPDWLKGYRKRNLEIDLWNEKLALGVEVQGVQHFDPNSFNAGHEKFSDQYANDVRKIELCALREITLIHVLYFQDTKGKIIKQLHTELIRKKRQELAKFFDGGE